MAKIVFESSLDGSKVILLNKYLTIRNNNKDNKGLTSQIYQRVVRLSQLHWPCILSFLFVWRAAMKDPDRNLLKIVLTLLILVETLLVKVKIYYTRSREDEMVRLLCLEMLDLKVSTIQFWKV